MNPERVQIIIPFQDSFNKNPALIFRSIYFLNLQISICIAIRYINGKSIDSSFFKCFIILHFQISGIWIVISSTFNSESRVLSAQVYSGKEMKGDLLKNNFSLIH